MRWHRAVSCCSAVAQPICSDDVAYLSWALHCTPLPRLPAALLRDPKSNSPRAVQGLGGALVFPSTLAVINTTFAEGRDRNRALGIWGGAGAAGLVVGALL